MSFVGVIRASDVRDERSYANFVQQQCGTPYCSTNDLIVLRKCVRDFRERYPHLADNPWPTLVRAAMWVRSKRKRPAKVYTVVRVMLAWAWEDGALPELDPTRYVDPKVEEGIALALQGERDPIWRDRLIGAEGSARGEVLRAWQQRSSPSPVA